MGARPPADTAHVRQINPFTNLLLTVLCAAGLALSIGLPWFAGKRPAGEDDGTLEALASDIARVFAQGGVAGTDSLGSARPVLLVLAAVTAVLAVLHLVPALRRLVRTPLRLVPLAAPVVVLVQAVDAPDGFELRWGLLVALAVSAYMASSAFHGAELREKRPKPAPYRPPAAPAGSAPPPGL